MINAREVEATARQLTMCSSLPYLFLHLADNIQNEGMCSFVLLNATTLWRHPVMVLVGEKVMPNRYTPLWLSNV